MIIIAKASACRPGVLAVFIGAKEADDGVNDSTNCANNGEEEPSNKVASDCWP